MNGERFLVISYRCPAGLGKLLPPEAVQLTNPPSNQPTIQPTHHFAYPLNASANASLARLNASPTLDIASLTVLE